MSRCKELSCSRSITDRSRSIIAVPAIGANPRDTWTRKGENLNQLEVALRQQIPIADILLYDHLTLKERQPKARATKNFEHKNTAEDNASIEAAVGGYGLVEWADCFYTIVQHNRSSRAVRINTASL